MKAENQKRIFLKKAQRKKKTKGPKKTSLKRKVGKQKSVFFLFLGIFFT